MKIFHAIAASILTLALGATMPAKASEEYSFLVISQRSPRMTADYWGPILRWISERSGVALSMKITRTGPEHTLSVRKGEHDFIYSNHQFTPGVDAAGYRVIARTAEAAIAGQIVVLDDSAIRAVADLRGKEVVFASRTAFLGFFVPMDALLRAGVEVVPHFAGTQEGAMSQLKARRRVAAAVNSEIMRDYAQREGFKYRAIWTSEPYLPIPIAVHPRVPRAVADRVAAQLIRMAADPNGRQVLQASSKLAEQAVPLAFTAATDAEYDNVVRFHSESLVRGKEFP